MIKFTDGSHMLRKSNKGTNLQDLPERKSSGDPKTLPMAEKIPEASELATLPITCIDSVFTKT